MGFGEHIEIWSKAKEVGPWWENLHRVLVHPQSRDRDSVDTRWDKGDEIGWFWAEKLPAPGHIGVGIGPRYVQLPLVLCSVNRGIANVSPCSNITQSSPDFYNPSKEKMSKAQVKVLEHLAVFWGLYVGNLPDYILQTQILEDLSP